jgi:flagellar biosynthetic protein FliP
LTLLLLAAAAAPAPPATLDPAAGWLGAAPLWALFFGVLLLGTIKLGVVLEVLRRGLYGIPPAPVTALLALLLSVFAMMPLHERCQQAMQSVPAAAPVETRLQAGLLPLREFLTRHTPAAERSAVNDLARRLNPRLGAAPGEVSLPSLLVGFALAELRAAFQLSFVLLLPFLLIDLLCASLLSGLLLPGLSARAVALPFKLLLFVLCDGWQLLLRGLLSAYGAVSGGGT